LEKRANFASFGHFWPEVIKTSKVQIFKKWHFPGPLKSKISIFGQKVKIFPTTREKN
jgi:hypothetical protein